MKKKTFLILALVLAVFSSPRLTAQERMRNYHFVYIDHETSTPTQQLCTRLDKLRQDAIEIGDPLFIYLSGGASSLLSMTNVQDKAGLERDKDEAYFNIIEGLQNRNYHSVSPRIDRKNLLKFFGDYNFVNDEGQFLYKTVILDFYVGPSFWALGNNEKVLAHLFFALEASKMPQNQFFFNVFKPKGQSLLYTKGKTFGELNIDNINNQLKIFEY